MFRPLERNNNDILRIDETTFLKRTEHDAPFYSKLELYHENRCISDCSFKHQEMAKIKEHFSDFNSLMNTLQELNEEVKSEYLADFIDLIKTSRPIPIKG